jgi:hypothetical protein
MTFEEYINKTLANYSVNLDKIVWILYKKLSYREVTFFFIHKDFENNIKINFLETDIQDQIIEKSNSKYCLYADINNLKTELTRYLRESNEVFKIEEL